MVTDSPVTIVGAMVVGPEFGPLAALAVAIVRRERRLARRSLLALVVGFPVAMPVTAVGALAAEAAGWLSLETFDRVHQVDFIYEVGPFSLVVALLAGSAGMLALVSSKSAALVGVFISVTTVTVPAAGFAVVAATVGSGTWRCCRHASSGEHDRHRLRGGAGTGAAPASATGAAASAGRATGPGLCRMARWRNLFEINRTARSVFAGRAGMWLRGWAER